MGGKNQTQTQNQSSSTTPAGLSQLQDIWGRVQEVASQPYQAYGGPMVADLSGTQRAGIEGVTNAQGAAQPYFNTAADYARSGAAPIDYAEIQRYQSPYTQQVVDATRANFSQENAKQQSQMVGNSAARGALGSRTGINQAELARQQRMAQDPVIANLYASGYDKSLQAAQADRSAQAQGAYTFGALAPSVQNAQISGAQAQIGAGGLEQGNEQAKMSAAYNQYLQQLAFPYQQAGFLASAGMPAVTSMGGTSTGTGTTTQPGPNPWVQAAGLGLSAASMFSDSRIKKNKRKIGKTFDGQPIYSFTYGDSPQTHIGLMAQDVERRHPEAVGDVGGVKTVDYEMATDDAARRRGFAGGGVVNLLDVPTYVPSFRGAGGGGGGQSFAPAPMLNMGAPQQQADPFAGLTADKFRSAGMGLRNLSSSMFPAQGGNYDAGMSMAIPSSLTGMVGGGLKRGGRVSERHARFHDTVHAIRQTLRRGGAVHGYADGGGVGFGDRFNASFDLSPSEYVSRGFDETRDAISSGTFDPQGMNMPGPMAFADPSQMPVPMPRARPPEAPPGPMVNTAGLPPIMTQDDALPPDAMAYSRPKTSPYAAPPVAPAATPMATTPLSARPESSMGGWNPLGLSDDARAGLMAAGLGIAASKSPFALSAIGEGGLTGVKTYSDQKTQRAKVESEARRLAQQASQFAQNLDLHKDQLKESTRHHTAQEGLAQKPSLTVIGRDEYGNPKYGIFNPRDQSVKEIPKGTPQLSSTDPGAGTEPAVKPPVPPPTQLSEDSELPKNATLVSGDDAFLQGLSSEDRNMVKAMVEGRQPPPPGKALATPFWRRMMQLASTYDPSFDQGRWSARVQTRKNFATGVEGRTIRSLNTVANHLGELDEAGQALDNFKSNSLGTTKTANTILNWYRENAGDPRITKFDTASNAVSTELEKAFRGNQTAISGIKEWRKAMSHTMAPEQMRESNKTLAKLLMGQLEGLAGQYTAGMGVNADPLTILQPQAAKIFQKLLGTLPEGATGEEKPAAKTEGAAKPPAAVQRPASVPPGSQYSASRKQWRDPGGKFYDASGAPVP